jgi:hypothetical protein
MALTVIPVTFPRDLEGIQNGRLPAPLLVDVGLRGRLHQLAARAWFALCAEGKANGWHLTYTFGGCYRTYEEQRTLFLQRYQMEPIPGRPTKMWEGVRWYQKPGTAMAAVPGTSNHGLGLAVDAALDLDLSDGVGPGDASSIVPALGWFHDVALRYGFSFEAQSEPWHIRYVSGDRIPDAVLAYEDSLKPKPPPPPPIPSESDRMFIIVGNADNKADPRRWVWDGAVAMRLLASEADYQALLNRAAVGLCKLHPSFAGLADPFWMASTERSLYGQAA